jgi:hypothetical protein
VVGGRRANKHGTIVPNIGSVRRHISWSPVKWPKRSHEAVSIAIYIFKLRPPNTHTPATGAMMMESAPALRVFRQRRGFRERTKGDRSGRRGAARGGGWAADAWRNPNSSTFGTNNLILVSIFTHLLNIYCTIQIVQVVDSGIRPKSAVCPTPDPDCRAPHSHPATRSKDPCLDQCHRPIARASVRASC